jgi:hypothetical protein
VDVAEMIELMGFMEAANASSANHGAVTVVPLR